VSYSQPRVIFTASGCALIYFIANRQSPLYYKYILEILTLRDKDFLVFLLTERREGTFPHNRSIELISRRPTRDG